MHITHSFIGAYIGENRCLLFLLYKDYIQEQNNFVRELNPYLERFARKLGYSAALVRPFSGDIESTRAQVLDKNWSESELNEILKTPGLLLINKDFESFNPQSDDWIYINLGQKIFQDSSPLVDELLGEISETIINPKVNIFSETNKILLKSSLKDAGEIFEAKPGAFGFSLDLMKAFELFPNFLNKIKSRHQ